MALTAGAVLTGRAVPAEAQEAITGPTVPEMLVPSDTSPASPSTTAAGDSGDVADDDPGPPLGEAGRVPAEGTAADDGLAASTKVWIIIGALVAVALLILVLTILYWRRTRPVAVTVDEPTAEPTSPVAVPAPAAAASPSDAETGGSDTAGSAVPDEPIDTDASAGGPAAPVASGDSTEEASSTPAEGAADESAIQSAPAAEAPASEPDAPDVESPRPVGDDPPVDPRRSVFAPQPSSE